MSVLRVKRSCINPLLGLMTCRYQFIKYLFTTLLLVIAFNVNALCDLSSLPLGPTQGNQRDDVLVLVNENSLSSCNVGVYYAQKRELLRDNVASIYSPNIKVLNWEEFRNVRDQLIDHMSQDVLLNSRPTADQNRPVCDDTTPEQIGTTSYFCQASVDWLRTYTKIRYIVTTKGVPTRVDIGDPCCAVSGVGGSFDNYLRHWIIRYFPDVNGDANGYSDDIQFSGINFQNRFRGFTDGRGMRLVEPINDAEFIVGRIDGITEEKAKALVDRAINAEINGIYGKLYIDEFDYSWPTSQLKWFDYQNGERVYGQMDEDGRKYPFGIWGEDRTLCTDTSYLNFDANTPAGQADQSCLVKYTGNNTTPGLHNATDPNISESSTPIVDDSLAYFNSVPPGQSSGQGLFNTLTHWVKDENCSNTLCKNAADPAACKAVSTDVVGEFDTRCVGVADGFIGFVHRSFPVAHTSIWPTGWQSASSGGGIEQYASPRVREDDGDGDNRSWWFGNTDSPTVPLCYIDGTAANSSEDFTVAPIENCRDAWRIGAITDVELQTPIIINLSTPQQLNLGLSYKVQNLGVGESDSIRFRLRVFDPNFPNLGEEPGKWIDHGTQNVNFSSDVAWTAAQLNPIQLDLSQHGWPINTVPSISRIEVRFLTTDFRGQLGIDNVSVQEAGVNQELIVNGSFDGGHEQVSRGDHAAMYLSRLNGTAFWGSVSHYGSAGHSFAKQTLERLIYFFRGLPVGDAVWWGVDLSSGILYGDPLYSPAAVHLHYLQSIKNSYVDKDYAFIDELVPLWGDALNGLDTGTGGEVTTTYSVEYCDLGYDFYLCDQQGAGAWQQVVPSQTGGFRNGSLGDWDTTGLVAGSYTLRLGVRSQHGMKLKDQTFYDYLPVTLIDADADDDGDGLPNKDELTIYLSDPYDQDTDDDGLNDDVEVALGSDLNSTDSDGDAIDDATEYAAGLDLMTRDALLDKDGDGVLNIIEFLRTTDINDVLSLPTLTSWYVDQSYAGGDDDGSFDKPFSDASVALSAASAGDTIYLKSDYTSVDNVFISNAVRISGYSSTTQIPRLMAPRINFQPVYKWAELTNLELVQSPASTLSPFVVLRGQNKTLRNNAIKVTVANTSAVGVNGTALGRYVRNNVILGGPTMTGIEAGPATIVNNTIVGFDIGINKTTADVSMLVENNIFENIDDIANYIATDTIQYNLLNDEFVGQFNNADGFTAFVDANGGDYHVKPLSSGIDSGNPASDYSAELGINGHRINMGAYGGTSEAASNTQILILPILYQLLH